MFERILLAVNQSETSRKAADVAADIAQKYGAEVVVLHILERHMAKSGGYEFEPPDGGVELVEGIVRAMKDAGVSARGEIQTAASGTIPRAILESAREQDANLIVLGSRRLSDGDELLLKSVSHRVLHQPGCPVVVVTR